MRTGGFFVCLFVLGGGLLSSWSFYFYWQRPRELLQAGLSVTTSASTNSKYADGNACSTGSSVCRASYSSHQVSSSASLNAFAFCWLKVNLGCCLLVLTCTRDTVIGSRTFILTLFTRFSPNLWGELIGSHFSAVGNYVPIFLMRSSNLRTFSTPLLWDAYPVIPMKSVTTHLFLLALLKSVAEMAKCTQMGRFLHTVEASCDKNQHLFHCHLFNSPVMETLDASSCHYSLF